MAKQVVAGILAHVDAGKTTLSEALLYTAGARRYLGRVDHGDAFLDTDRLERERGITIFGKTALFSVNDINFTLVDTPGHIDFSAEMERTLPILDLAILVINGSDGIQSHTHTLLRLLDRSNIPVFVFVNKMDLAGSDRSIVMSQLTEALPGCVDFSTEDRDECIAMCDESALDTFLDNGSVPDEMIASLIRRRKVYPLFFGSALKLDGIDVFLDALSRFAPSAQCEKDFGARVFKISRDAQGARLTWMRITGGTLRVKTQLAYRFGGETISEKADQLRLYSGEKYQLASELTPGMVAAVTGFSHTRPGQVFGTATEPVPPMLQPVLTYQLHLPEGSEPFAFLPKLRELEDEDPMLHVVWNERSQEIQIQLMGPIQLEVLKQVILERFGQEVSFGTGSIVYRETIASAVIGMGHFEPLRHYAEVHLLMEPGEPGSGIHVASAVSIDDLALNWQRLIFTHIFECEHPGVLTGSPLTDVKITLVAGRSHLKHTEGGDFRQATYRAIRQGLMQAQSILLEPFYDFILHLPNEYCGRAINDLQEIGASIDPPGSNGNSTILTGYAPVAGLREYAQELAAYSHGIGRLSCTVRGFGPCRTAEAVIQEIGYDPDRDIDHPSSSVFCDHGGSITVPWDKAASMMHLNSGISVGTPSAPVEKPTIRPIPNSSVEEKELQTIFERTYGKVAPKAFEPAKPPARTALDDDRYNTELRLGGTEYLLVDGYNVIFAWEELQKLAREDISAARAALTAILANYQGFRKCVVILVFDAYKVKGNPGSVETVDGVKVVYTKEAQTADAYIERATYELRRERRVRVATSDGLEQVIILGHGAQRVSASAFHAEVEAANGEISRLVRRFNDRNRRGNSIRDIAKFTQ